MRIKREKRMKYLAVLSVFLLIGTVGALAVSQSLMWNITAEPANFRLEWATSAPTTLSVLYPLTATLNVIKQSTPSDFEGNLEFSVITYPAGADIDDFVIYDESMVEATLTGEIYSIPFDLIYGGATTTPVTFSVSLNVAGAWQIQIVLTGAFV